MSQPDDLPRISQANAHRPPQHRRRVWRACESCRKKKVKCDGSEPCKPCRGYGIACVYPDATPQCIPEANNDTVGTRLQTLEELVAKLVQAQTQTPQVPPSPSPPRVQPQLHHQLQHIQQPQPQPPAQELTPTLSNLPPFDDLISPTNLHDLLLSTAAIDPSLSLSTLFPVPRPASPPLPSPIQVHIQTYTDHFGQLEIDKNGSTRYVGLGATVCIVDNCDGLRRRIQNGLANKGFAPQESVLDSTSTASPGLNAPSPIGWWAGELPPAGLLSVVVERYFCNLHALFPVVCEGEFRERYGYLLRGAGDGGLDRGVGETANSPGDEPLSLLYAVLAVAAPLVPSDDLVYAQPDAWRYQGTDLGAHFFGLAMSSLRASSTSPSVDPMTVGEGGPRNDALHTIMAHALLSVHLTQIGMPREAWKMLSHAVRLGQDMGLHRSPLKFHLPRTQQTHRRRIWWCLYIFDRLLSMNLGRPLAIDDTDCDVELPTEAESPTSSFIAMIQLSRIIGRVLRVSNSVANVARWRDPVNHPELRDTVTSISAELDDWQQTYLPNAFPTSPSAGDSTVEQYILQSTFLATVILLFRPLMSNPHRPSPLGNNMAMKRCLAASTACIRMTTGYLDVGTVSYSMVLHGQTVFICVVVLMHCMRLVNLTSHGGHTGTTEEAEDNHDGDILRAAVEDCQVGIGLLVRLEGFWVAARQCRAVAEEYLEFTLDVLERGGGKAGCSFEEDDSHEVDCVVAGKRRGPAGHEGRERKRGRPCTFMLRR